MAHFNICFYERAIRRERVFKDRSNPLEVLSEKELLEKLRFPRHAIQELAIDLEEHLRPETSRNFSISPLLQVCLALRFFATGCFINTAADLIGVHKSTASRIIHRVACALSGRLPLYPTDVSTLNKVKADFFNIAGFPNVVGAIDGTHIRIQAPSTHEPLFVNRKGYHSINVQAICDAKLRVLNCVARWPGSTHDSRILVNSQIHDAFERGELQGVLLGDSGYPLKPWLLTPFLNPVSVPQARYNTAHTKTRNVIERCFGVLKRRFHCLHAELKMKPEKVCNIICACVVLHNMARDLALPDLEDDQICEEPTLEITEAGGEDGSGRYIRQMIVENIFSV
uniref:Putative nuclease HARBI1 n=1 Tax=Cyprinus carpio TaxID=7962 RepID=A0A8C1XYL4_CYPCA